MNNAGIPGPVGVPIGNVEEADWDDVMNINLRAVWLCMKFEIAAMLAADGGSIVNVSSIYGYKSNPLGGGPYSASKHAVIGLTKSAAIDYADRAYGSTSSRRASPARKWSILMGRIGPKR